jgi:hypothetical protein
MKLNVFFKTIQNTLSLKRSIKFPNPTHTGSVRKFHFTNIKYPNHPMAKPKKID